jgi:hypothetical protein
MSRRRDKARIAELEARDLVRLDRITELEGKLKSTTAPRAGVTAREAELAGRVIDLERLLKTTQAQLDNATKSGDDGWSWAPRPAPRPDGEVSS